MKNVFVVMAFWMGSVGAFAQGQINFSNLPFFTTGTSASEPAVYDVDGTTRMAGPANLAQLYWSATPFNGIFGGGVAAEGSPVPFFTVESGKPGFFDGGTRTVGVPAGAAVFVQVRVWRAAAGATWELAIPNPSMAAFGSAVLSLTAGGGTNPPANLNGLSRFSFPLGGIIPEPSTVVLGVFGAGVLMLRRRM